eukprot:56832-Pleurochrysis_carterae.AAC.3
MEVDEIESATAMDETVKTKLEPEPIYSLAFRMGARCCRLPSSMGGGEERNKRGQRDSKKTIQLEKRSRAKDKMSGEIGSRAESRELGRGIRSRELGRGI